MTTRQPAFCPVPGHGSANSPVSLPPCDRAGLVWPPVRKRGDHPSPRSFDLVGEFDLEQIGQQVGGLPDMDLALDADPLDLVGGSAGVLDADLEVVQDHLKLVKPPEYHEATLGVLVARRQLQGIDDGRRLAAGRGWGKRARRAGGVQVPSSTFCGRK